MARFVFLKYPFWNLPFCIITNFFLLSCIFFCDCEINVMVLVHILFIKKRCRFRNARLKFMRNYSSIFEPFQNNGSIYTSYDYKHKLSKAYIYVRETDNHATSNSWKICILTTMEKYIRALFKCLGQKIGIENVLSLL